MNHALPSHASAVIIGGGVIGGSVAYHLAKLGWQDVVLLERKQFTCGTTWHAAGLIGTMRATETHARLCEYSMSLLDELEQQTGQSTGFRQVGSLTVAHSVDRLEELKRVASMNNAFGVTRVDVISPGEAKERFPLLYTGDLLGATWVEQDGVASPIDTTMAFIKGARQHGALCLEGVTVTGIDSHNGRVTGVQTDHGEIQAEFVVNCGGLWGREIGKMAGVRVPLHACEHYYAVTEKLADLPDHLPVVRDHDNSAYFREDAGSLMVGIFEKKAVAWGQHGIPTGFCFDELEGHMEQQLLPILEKAMQRIPLLQDAGWRTFFCGPESFTPDDQFHLGEAPELKNFYVAAGLNSVGIQMSGGVGLALAEWMEHGQATMDLWGNDIRRMHPVQNTQSYLQDRVTETLGLLYQRHYPFRQYTTARNVRHSPLHERLVSRNACFGELAGWERPNWFAPEGIQPEYQYSFGKQNWFEYSAAEHQATRENVALFDQSSFSKFQVEGRDACACLQQICSADIDVPAGKVVYTHWLNERGGIEADLTVSRISENQYWVISAAATAGKDLHWLKTNIPEDAHCVITDITNSWAVMGVMGPGSRALLEQALGIDLSSEVFPFGSWQSIELGAATGRAFRVSFVGELGWELYIPTEQAHHAFDQLWNIGLEFGLRPAGFHALDSCRIEKKFLHLGHDVGNEDTPLEAGVGFVCHTDKQGGFIGRDAILRQRETGEWRKKRLVQFLLLDPEAMLYHHEPIWQDGKLVGHLTSGNYGHTLGGSVGLGYIYQQAPINTQMLAQSSFEIEVAGVRVPARASLSAMYDPRAERMRA